jgi:hypothetical protein
MLEQWMEDDHSEFTRTEQCLVDMQYIISAPPNGELSPAIYKNFLKGVQTFLDILDCIQVRKTFLFFFKTCFY